MIFEDGEHVTSPDDVGEQVHHRISIREFVDSKERLSDIINFLPDATFVIDTDGCVVSWNHAMEKMTHVKAENMLGKGNYEYSLPFYGKRRKILVDLSMSSNHQIESEYDLIWRESSSITGEILIHSLRGKPTYLWGKASPIFDHRGTLVGAIESIRDITLQKRAELELKSYREHLEELVQDRTEELRNANEMLHVEVEKREEINRVLHESEKNYHDIFKHAGIGIFQSTPEGRFINVNITMANMFGYRSPEEMINSIKNIGEQIYTSPQYRSEIMEHITGEPGIIKFENELIRKNGENWVADLNLRVVRDENKSPLYFEGFVQDITSKKRIEKALKESEAKYRTIFENTGTATMIIEEDRSISLINTEFERITGYTKNEVLGSSWIEYVVKEDRDRIIHYNELRYADSDSAPNNYEFRFIKKDKSTGYAYINIEMIPGTRQLIASIVDITEKKDDEKRLYRLNEKLKRSNKELEQYAYVASHDLKEPLRMIITFLRLLKKKYSDGLDDDAHEYIDFAVDGAEHLDTMINHLLEYAKVAHDEIEFSVVDSDELFNEILESLKASIEENSAVITYDALPKIYCNKNLIFELFQNLISNAIKYRGSEPPRIHVSAIREGNEFIFSVRDNGIGISEKDLERIFVIFNRLHTREEYNGTGIGLAIAQKIVEQHGGMIWADSEPGKGTCFNFTIPIS